MVVEPLIARVRRAELFLGRASTPASTPRRIETPDRHRSAVGVGVGGP